jgi:hypothetical protein
MSKGSPIISLRLSPLVLAAVDAAIERGNKYRTAAPWTRTAWIHAAIHEKLAHSIRSNRPKKSRRSKQQES